MKYSEEQLQEKVASGKPYWLVELREGPERCQDEKEGRKIQMGHLDHLFTLKDKGHLLLAGPTPKADGLRGICIFDGSLTKEEVEKLMSQDPTVIHGRLVPKVIDFFGIPGDGLK